MSFAEKVNKTRDELLARGLKSNCGRTEEELDWINAVVEGDEHAFEQLYTYYHPRLGKFLMRYVSSQNIAEDLIHNVFMHIWKNREQIKKGVSLRSYLYTAAKNQALHYVSRSSKLVSLDLSIYSHQKVSLPADDEACIEYKEFELKIKRLLSSVPEQRRRIFLMHREDELTYREIARILGLSVKTVETQISRTLKFLYEKTSLSL